MNKSLKMILSMGVVISVVSSLYQVQGVQEKDKSGIYYEVFVRSFADSNKDSIGDFKGLTKKLDYLNDGNPKTNTDLGVNGIWLMPINTSPSYHKYDVTDYYNIDPEYGTLKDFETFIKEAHKRGIKVIMDLVVNHTSSEHPWFKKASASEKSSFRNYYTWAKEGQKSHNLSGQSSWGSSVWHESDDSYYYGIFWSGMPDLNYSNKKVRSEIDSVGQYWLKKGVDGFRLDAAVHIFGDYELPNGKKGALKNIEWWEEFKKACLKVNPNAYLVGEVWDKPEVIAPYFKPLDSNFNFPLGTDVIEALQGGNDLESKKNGMALKLEKTYKEYARVNPKFIDAPFLTNHDQERIMSALSADTAKAKVAASILLTLPGNPFIYYGEEIGMLGRKPDERIREPFKWSKKFKLPMTAWEDNSFNRDTPSVEEQEKEKSSLLNHYKNLIRLRQSSRALTYGDFKALIGDNDKVIGYSRSIAGGNNSTDTVVILHNINARKQKVTIKGIKLSEYKTVFQSSRTKFKFSGQGVEIPALSTVILEKVK